MQPKKTNVIMQRFLNWMLTSCRAYIPANAPTRSLSRSTKRASFFCARSIVALAAILICGASVLTSCTSDTSDNPVTPNLNGAEKIIGKWMVSERGGQPALTNEKRVVTFLSSTKAYMSASRNKVTESGGLWSDHTEADVTIVGNKVTLTMHPDEHTKMVDEFDITSINDKEFTARLKVTAIVNGIEERVTENIIRFVKVTADYSEAVLGLWECTGLTGIETYNDANARLEFLSDGTYRYYRKDDAGQWLAVTTRDFQDYFVDGTLLATRWKNQGEDSELREWWEIENLNANEMVWTGLRQNADGTTVLQKMTWKKIDLNVSEKIIGKWMIADRDGQPEPSNRKAVITFVSATKVLKSVSFSEQMTHWLDQQEVDVKIDGNKITLTSHANENVTLVEIWIVSTINDTEFVANRELTKTSDGIVIVSRKDVVRFEKVTTDYRDAIVGTWEGRCTSEGSVFDDGQEHRWQYRADGTFVYYVKDGDSWVPSDNSLNEYFVDGTLLCTRWIDNEVENREWWEITIAGDKMNWTALRQKEDGSTFTATFEMEKVE